MAKDGGGGADEHPCPIGTFNLQSTDLPNQSELAPIDTRFRIVTEKILPRQVQDGCILCFQEASQKWSVLLEPWFRARGYKWEIAHYYGGSMGVAIAYPTKLYCGRDPIVNKISNTIDRVTNRHGLEKRRNCCQWILWFLRACTLCLLFALVSIVLVLSWVMTRWCLLCCFPRSCSGRLGGWYAAKESIRQSLQLLVSDPYTRAKRLQNLMLTVLLRHRVTGKILSVSTYHMPCRFWDADVMSIHATAALWQARQCAMRSVDMADFMVVPGDWNMKPTDDLYHNVSVEGLTWRMCTWKCGKPVMVRADAGGDDDRELDVYPMRSAVRYATDKEPSFTCRTKGGFTETLDYIWFVSLWDPARDSRWKMRLRGTQVWNQSHLSDASDHVFLRAHFAMVLS